MKSHRTHEMLPSSVEAKVKFGLKHTTKSYNITNMYIRFPDMVSSTVEAKIPFYQNVGMTNTYAFLIWFPQQLRQKYHFIKKITKLMYAPNGNRTHGKCLEGIYVTTTP